MRWSELLFQAPCRPQQDTGLYICFGLLQLLLKEEGKHAGVDCGAPLHRLWLSRVNPICPEQWNMLDATPTMLLQFKPNYYQLRTLSHTEFSMNKPKGVTVKKYYIDYDEFSSIGLVFLTGEITLEDGFPKLQLKVRSQLEVKSWDLSGQSQNNFPESYSVTHKHTHPDASH